MYCTLADIEKKRIPTDLLIQLTDDDDLEVINMETVNGVIEDAQVLFESYVRGRYPLPLDPVPDLAVTITADLAAYGMFGLKPTFDIPKTIQARRDTALALMTRIQDGKMPLYDPVVAPPATGGDAVQFNAPTAVFTEDTLRNF